MTTPIFDSRRTISGLVLALAAAACGAQECDGLTKKQCTALRKATAGVIAFADACGNKICTGPGPKPNLPIGLAEKQKITRGMALMARELDIDLKQLAAEAGPKGAVAPK